MIIAPLLLAHAAFAQIPAAVVPKLAVTESARYEVKTTSGSTLNGSWSETQSASRTKLTITAELPLAGLEIDGETRLEMKVGSLSFDGVLKSDPAYRPGIQSAQLVQTAAAGGKGAVRAVVAKADLRWNADRLTVKIVADGPNAPSVAAMAFKNDQIGPFEARAKGSIVFGNRRAEFDVPIKGRIARKSVDRDGLSGSATTVDLKGEAKAG